ncbi:MAG TPA: hypothetical protein VF221_06725 [Chloroflexota bacterium]
MGDSVSSEEDVSALEYPPVVRADALPVTRTAWPLGARVMSAPPVRQALIAAGVALAAEGVRFILQRRHTRTDVTPRSPDSYISITYTSAWIFRDSDRPR